MNRRDFLIDMLKCGIATTFLPGAGRIWKPSRYIIGEWECLLPVPKKTEQLNLNELFDIMWKLKEYRIARGEEPFCAVYKEIDDTIRQRMGIVTTTRVWELK